MAELERRLNNGIVNIPVNSAIAELQAFDDDEIQVSVSSPTFVTFQRNNPLLGKSAKSSAPFDKPSDAL